MTDTPVSASLLAPCPENPPCDPATPAASYSAYIAGGIFDHSAELGDAAHKAANSTQAHRLWQASGRDEAAFVALLHEARTRVRKGQGQQGSGSITNKMGHYFRCLAALLDAAP